MSVSYRPISLLNRDYKILAQILAKRLNMVISNIHNDQTGFIPGISTSINIRTQIVAELKGHIPNTSALASLDTARAFDSIEGPFLRVTMKRFGFGKGFIKWVGILYKQPWSNLLVNGMLSPPVKLYRGTRQGCPLSPQLFAIAIEALVLRFRQSKKYK